jgi:2-polyprenyl-3-methyl-5-hydroxy-6-metoxy-1,4-benzoquinol methylase
VNASYTSDDHAFRENDPYARAKYELTLRWLSPRIRAGETLYNVGVGSGYFNHLAAARGLSVVGCEPDSIAFASALATAPPSIELLNCGLAEFAAGRAPARFIVMHDVLEHIEDDASAAASLRSIVADDGVVILSVPALMSLYGLHDEQLGHYRRYTARSLRAVLEPHFVVRRLQWYGMASIPIAFYFSRWKRKSYPLGGSRSLIGDAYGAVCAAESYLQEPIGTSLVVELLPRG